MRELQSLLTLLPGLIKALPIVIAYLVLIRYAIGTVRGWRQPIAGQEMAYALAGVAAFLWAVGR